MSFDTIMWIIFALWAVFLIGLVGVAEYTGRKRIKNERRRFQDELDRRYNR